MPFEVPDIFGHVDWMLFPQYWFRLGVNDSLNGRDRDEEDAGDFQQQYLEGFDFGVYQKTMTTRSPFM